MEPSNKGESYRLICGRTFGDRKEFMREYGKAAESRKWHSEERDVTNENGHIRWGKIMKHNETTLT